MQIVGQAGLGTAGGAIASLAYVFTVGILVLIAFAVFWFSLPGIIWRIQNLFQQRDTIAESEADRRMEGRLFTSYPESERPAKRE